MKSTLLNSVIALLFVVIGVSCDSEPAGVSLKESLDKGVKELNAAVDKIKTSADFQLLSQNDESAATGMAKAPAFSEWYFMPNDTVMITLDKVAGIYDYSWQRVKTNNPYYRFFTKTGESEYMIVRLPVQKVRHPAAMFWHQKADTALTNNFEAKVTDYYVFRNRKAGNEYRLTSDFSIDNAQIGSLTELSSRNKVNGYNASSVYTLASGYTVSRTENSGDTAVSAYAISEGDKILYEEKMTSVRLTDKKIRYREKTYSLTVGNVKIVRNLKPESMDSAQVHLNGVLQTNSKVEIIVIQPDSLNQCLTHATRDLKITFDDGTSTTLKTLMNETIDGIQQIFRRVQKARFTTDIIDRIAWNIYSRKK